jgi:hypothetical protein
MKSCGNAARPGLLGVLYDAVAVAIRNLPNTTLAELPRMADFALWATAAEPALGLASGGFMLAYAGNRAAGNELALESSPVGKVLLDFMATRSAWTGNPSDLLDELDAQADEKTTRLRGWPKSARSLSGIIKRLAPNLRAAGVSVELGRTSRGRYITLGRIKESNVISDISVIDPGNNGDSADGHDASMTQERAGMTQENPGNDASDDDDARIPAYSAGERF